MRIFFTIFTILTFFSYSYGIQNISPDDMKILTDEATKQNISEEELLTQMQANGITNKKDAYASLEKKQKIGNLKNKIKIKDKSTIENIQKPKKEIKNISITQEDSIPVKIVDKYFGYNLFKTIPEAFLPNSIGAVDPNYIVGIGDVLKVTIWGNVDISQELHIDKSGRIYLKNIGPVTVAGSSIDKTQKKLKRLYGKIFSGLNGKNPNTWIDISITNMKPKQIFIMGDVKNPGGYTVNSNSTVFNSLFSVGGPTTSGSLREIRVIRNNKIITKVDLYKFLTGAKKTNDIRIQNNDIIFVPPRISSVTIKGEINKPYTYELKKGETLNDLIRFAGGLKSTAYAQQGVIYRVKPVLDRKKESIDRFVLNFNPQKVLKKKEKIKLYDLDVVNINKIDDEVKNFITVSGEVLNPDKLEFKDGMTLNEAIKNSGGLLPTTYLKKAKLIRYNPDRTYETISLSLKNLDTKDGNLKLQSRDSIVFYSKPNLSSDEYIYLKGLIKDTLPIRYAKGITLYDVLFDKAKIKDSLVLKDIYQKRGSIIRLNKETNTKSIINFIPLDIINQKSNITLMPEDSVYLYPSNLKKVIYKFVEIKGEVKNPGIFELTKNMTISDLIFLANGFKEGGEQHFAEISRALPLTNSNENIIAEPIKVNLSELDKSQQNKIILHHRDIVYIRKNPNYRSQQTISITGAVKYPGDYTLTKTNETLRNIINRSGGFNADAFPEGSILMRDSIRVIVNFKKTMIDDDFNIILKNGDKIIIKTKPNTVKLTGEINTPGYLGYKRGAKLWDYINYAGNIKDSANYIILTEPSGISKKYSTGYFSKNCWGNPKIIDGSNILITKLHPQKQNAPIDWNKMVKNSVAMLTSAATLVLLFYTIRSKQ